MEGPQQDGANPTPPTVRVPAALDVNALPLISFGVSGAVFCLSDEAVIKKPTPLPNCRDQIDVECRIYQRLGRHLCTTAFLGQYQGMPILEQLQYPLRKRLWDFRERCLVPAREEAVDISAGNILLDWDNNAKLSDLARSSIDGCPPLVVPTIHSEHPRWPATAPTLRSELFALGSALYEIETTNKPYHDKDDSQVVCLFRQNKSTENMALGSIIQDCWFARYRNVAELAEDIQQLHRDAGVAECCLLASDRSESRGSRGPTFLRL